MTSPGKVGTREHRAAPEGAAPGWPAALSGPAGVALALQRARGNRLAAQTLPALGRRGPQLFPSGPALARFGGWGGWGWGGGTGGGAGGGGGVAPANDEAKGEAHTNLLRERDMFANLWLSTALGALGAAPEAPDRKSRAAFWVALAGNLLWAATTLVAPEALLAIRLMSIAGATVGSGTLTQNEPESAPSAEEVSKLLTTSRDLMVKSDYTLDAAVDEAVASGIVDGEGQRRLLWRKMFKTPYNEAEPIRAEMSEKIKKGLADFNTQWHEWDDALQEEVAGGHADGSRS